MKPARTNELARAIAPYVATILSISLAVTLRVQHSCSDSPVPATEPTSLRVVAGAEEMERDVRLVADHPAVVRLGRNVEETSRR
jgi:hypothetical protein